MSNPDPVPLGLDPSVPSVARVYDYFLGGKDNFEVDREAAEMLSKLHPDGRPIGQLNRSFLRRVVRHLAAEAGVRQFLDLGSGLPTQGNVHQIAQQGDPSARVVYVDNDAMALVHARALLADDRTTLVLQADVRQPAEILASWEVADFLDLSEPVGLLAFAILHHVGDDEDPAGIMAALRAAVPAGSYLAVSHFFNPGEENPAAAERARLAEQLFAEQLGTGRFRTRAEIESYFGDWELLDPGLVCLADWRPDPDDPPPDRTLAYHNVLCGVARKP